MTEHFMKKNRDRAAGEQCGAAVRLGEWSRS